MNTISGLVSVLMSIGTMAGSCYFLYLFIGPGDLSDWTALVHSVALQSASIVFRNEADQYLA